MCSDLRRRSGVDVNEDGAEHPFCQMADGPGGAESVRLVIAVVALHQAGDRLPGNAPLRLIGKDVGLGVAPAGKLAHGRDHGVVEDLPSPPGIDHAGHEVAPDQVEWSPGFTDPDPIAHPQRLEPIVIADRVALVLNQVLGDRQAPGGRAERGQQAVVVDSPVADRAGR